MSLLLGFQAQAKARPAIILKTWAISASTICRAPLITRLAELVVQTENNIHKICLVIDMRGGQFIQAIDAELEKLQEMGIDYTILYLEASNEVLVNRFKETRRQHPLSEDGSILSGIERERAALARIRDIASITLDTLELSKSERRARS